MSYEKLHKWVDYIRNVQEKDDNDLFVGVTGLKGVGKSTFSMTVARIYVEKFFGEKSLNLKKYVAYNNDDVMEKVHTLPMYSPLIGDEAVRFAWSRDWNRSTNKELIRLSAQIRTKRLIFFMNIPKLGWIDSAYREGMLDIWVWVHSNFSEGGKQSQALIFEPDSNQGYADSWHLEELRRYNKKRKKTRIGRFTDLDKIYSMIKSHPCFFDMFPFPKLPQEMYERYQKIRDAMAFEKQYDYVNQKDIGKIITYNLKNNWGKLMDAIKQGKKEIPSYRMISDILLKSPKTNQPVANYVTVANWFNEIKEKLPQEQIEVLQKTLEPEELEEERV